MENNNIYERFKKDTENHSLKIIKNDGLYRHLIFSKDGCSAYRIDIITWPGFLTVVGDMGEWVFSRDSDMFEFFKHANKGIDYRYYAEKCIATGKNDSIEIFSEKLFKKNIIEYIDSYYHEDEISPELKNKVMAQVNSEIFALIESEETAYRAASEFYFKEDDIQIDLTDFFEISNKEYSFRFEWILHAIVKIINEYNKETKKLGENKSEVKDR